MFRLDIKESLHGDFICRATSVRIGYGVDQQSAMGYKPMYRLGRVRALTYGLRRCETDI